MFENLTATSLIPVVSVVSALTFTLLERWKPYRAGLPIFREGYFVDLIWYTLIQSAFLALLIFDGIIHPLKDALGLSQNGYLHLPIWQLWLIFLVTHDFYIYCFHRAQHHNKWLWRTHEAHHSVREVDFLAGSRSHVLEIVINQTIEFMPIFFLLDHETAVTVAALKAMTDAVWGMFIHANLDVKLGWLGYIINGPRLHQWHHAEHREVYYANYSTKFAAFDYIFGTAFNPDYKPKQWGLPYDYPRDYFAQHVFSFHRFDVRKLEGNPTYKKYNESRVNAINWFLEKIGSKKRLPHTHLFAPNSESPYQDLVKSEVLDEEAVEA